MRSSPPKQLRIVDYDPSWPHRFAKAGAQLRDRLGDRALRIDHIGSTSVPGLAAKDLIDVQVTVARLDDADAWPEELLPHVVRRRDIVHDHVPAGATVAGADWTKRYWSRADQLHVHVRQAGAANQRYAVLFRDYLRASPTSMGAYAALKRALAEAAPDDWDTYYNVKDPACDLIIAGAEEWALRVQWTLGPSDA